MSFGLPVGWSEAGAVLATAFAELADCVAAIVEDQVPPTESGPAPSVDRSLVQVCAAPTDGRNLDLFVEETYGSDATAFRRETLGGREAFRLGMQPDEVIFVQTDRFRIQIVTAVAAAPDLAGLRASQVAWILEGMDFS